MRCHEVGGARTAARADLLGGLQLASKPCMECSAHDVRRSGCACSREPCLQLRRRCCPKTKRGAASRACAPRCPAVTASWLVLSRQQSAHVCKSQGKCIPQTGGCCAKALCMQRVSKGASASAAAGHQDARTPIIQSVCRRETSTYCTCPVIGARAGCDMTINLRIRAAPAAGFRCRPKRSRTRAAHRARSVHQNATSAAQQDLEAFLLQGTPRQTAVGKLVSYVFPPPVRFVAAWVPPLLTFVALCAPQTVHLLALLLGMLQVRAFRHFASCIRTNFQQAHTVP